MISSELRTAFVRYFAEQGHRQVPSAPVIPQADPSLLFVNAGMNPFKELFLRREQRDYTHAVSVQKCLRAGGKHNDLEQVGHSTHHLTFFEMLGNFSFGEYFKKEAIDFAWEVTMEVFQFPPESIWVTIHQEDEEALSLWSHHLPTERITRMEGKENFWSMAETGPCGPCSELFFDRGKETFSARNPAEDGEGRRFVEFWNLVFMQWEQRGGEEALLPLASPCIDTGAGLERIVALKCGVTHLFQADLLNELVHRIASLYGHRGDPHNSPLSSALYVITDHLRALSFALADGAAFSNEGRGYVLRKILRRAVRYAQKLAPSSAPSLSDALSPLLSLMGESYPELIRARTLIEEAMDREEGAFLRTLSRGGNLLQRLIEEKKKREQQLLSGEEAFRLKDTYGLPLDEILLIAQDEGFLVEVGRFRELEEEARLRSRKIQKRENEEGELLFFCRELLQKVGASLFEGYEREEGEGKIVGLYSPSAQERREFIEEGEEALLFLSHSPFYAERGGQVGDSGHLMGERGELFTVQETFSPHPGLIAHRGKVMRGHFSLDQVVKAEVDLKRRRQITLHHTATHLLHFALREIIGPHIRQAGSQVEERRLRLDFTHFAALTAEELEQVESRVEEEIAAAHWVYTREMDREEVQKDSSILSLFEEKYGERVRVVQCGPSRELCGGLHAANSSSLGLFCILRERSIASGTRRIEAVVGSAARERASQREREWRALYRQLKLQEENSGALLQRVQQLLQEKQSYEEEKSKQRERERIDWIEQQLQKREGQEGMTFQHLALFPQDGEKLRATALELAQRAAPAEVILFSEVKDKLLAVISIDKKRAREGKADARTLLAKLQDRLGGKGGGNAECCQLSLPSIPPTEKFLGQLSGFLFFPV